MSSDGPDEKVLISQITDYTDFKVIDKLDPDTYITEQFKNHEPLDADVFILVKKSGIYQRLIWGEPVKLKDKENQRWQEFNEYLEDNNLGPLPPYYLGDDRMGPRYTSKFLQGIN